MRRLRLLKSSASLLAAAVGMPLTACARAPERAQRQRLTCRQRQSRPPDEGARITQFYTTSAQVARGEKALVCYGVENAKTVWMEPPRQELSAALSRCVEVFPTADTTYKLTAEGPDGKHVTRELKVAVGAPRAKIVNVNVSALEVKAGELVSVCYTVEHAQGGDDRADRISRRGRGEGLRHGPAEEIDGSTRFRRWGRMGKRIRSG